MGIQTIQINNPNISQVQVSPGGGHGSNPYVKISTTDQGIIKIVDGIENTYETDGKETATIIFREVTKNVARYFSTNSAI